MKAITMIIALKTQTMSNTKENSFQDINPSLEMVEATSNQEQEVKYNNELFRRFIRTYHLTKQWETEIKKCSSKLKVLLILSKTDYNKIMLTLLEMEPRKVCFIINSLDKDLNKRASNELGAEGNQEINYDYLMEE